MSEQNAEIDPVKALITNVSSNPADIKFPTDRWGFTADVRKAVIRAGANMGSNKEKHDLLVNTLLVLLAHTKKRYNKAVAAAPAREAYLEKVREATALKQKQNYVR